MEKKGQDKWRRLKIHRSLIYIILTVTLLTSTSMVNVTGLAQGQMFQTECGITGKTTEEDLFRFEEELQQRNDNFRNGCIIGAGLGYLQGISDGSKDRIANATANPENNHTLSCVNDACAAFEDYHGITCVLPNNFHPLVPYVGNGSMVANFVQGYLNAYPDAYNAGYYIGYYLDKTIDQRYVFDEPSSANEELENTVEDRNTSSGGGMSRYSWWRSIH